MSLPRTSAALILTSALLAACATPETPQDVTGYQVVNSWPLEKAVQASAIAPEGNFALLNYKWAPGDDGLEIYRFNLKDGTSKTIKLERGPDGVMIRPTAEASAIAVSEDGATFLANWPGYLVSADAESGVMQAATSLPDAGFGMTSFNVLEYAPGGMAAFGLGSDVVRFDLTGEGLAHYRDVPAPGGQSLAVISPTKIATGSTEALIVTSAGAEAPDCTIDGIISALDTNPDRSRLAGAVYDQEANRTDIVIWSLADCQEMTRWPTGVSSVPDIAWLPGGDKIATAGGDGQLRFWNVATGAQADSLTVESDAGFKMHFSNDASHLVTFSLWGDRMLRAFHSQ